MEYWVCLKLYSGRLKDLGDLELVLSKVNIQLNMNILNRIFERHPILYGRWREFLEAFKRDYGRIVTRDGKIEKISHKWDPW